MRVACFATAEKLEAADAELAHTGRMGRFTAPFEKRGKDDQKLPKLTRDTGRLAVEQIKGISSQVGRQRHACHSPTVLVWINTGGTDRWHSVGSRFAQHDSALLVCS
jgi:hypothetical protein